MGFDPKNTSLAELIDHTLLRPEATEKEIEKICAEAREFGFKTVCIEAKWLRKATALLAGCRTAPITVVSFPGGDLSTERKAEATRSAILDGAAEVDMVLNRQLLHQKAYELVLNDIREVVRAAGRVPVKVILETSELSDVEKAIACALAKAAGAAFVKTSTGFSKGGATPSDIRLMRDVVGDEMGVKASGGVRTREDALAMLEAGASRLGTSASVSIVTSNQKPSAEGY